MSQPAPETTAAPKNYLFNVTFLGVVAGQPRPMPQTAPVVAVTIDSALTKFRVANADAEVTQIQRTGEVTV